MTEGELLKAIIPAISGVHGFCHLCADELVDDLNKILDKTDCEFRYIREGGDYEEEAYRVVPKRNVKKVAICEF